MIPVAVLAACHPAAARNWNVSSPHGQITVEVSQDGDRALYYSVERAGTTVLDKSRLGLVLKDVPDMADGFRVDKAATDSHAETWHPVWGEESSIDNVYNELRLDLSQPKAAPGRRMAVVFRVFDDGIGFRYEFPRQAALGDFTVMDELTEFNFTAAHRSWSLPVEGIRF